MAVRFRSGLMSKSRDADPPDEEQPYILGLPEQPGRPTVVRIKPAHRSSPGRQTHDLTEEQIKREDTVRSVKNRGPEKTWVTPEKRLPSPRAIALVVLLALIIVSGSLLAIRLVGRHQEPPPTIRPPSRPALSFLETASVAEIEAQAVATVQGFMNADSHAGRCRFVLGGESVEERMRAFYERPDSPTPARFGSILNSRDGAFGGHPIRIVFAAEDNGTVGWSFVLAGMKDRLVIDWEASVAYGQLSWADLLRDQPRQPVQMRVYLQRAFPDDLDPAKHHLYRVTARAEEEAFLATVPADSPLALRLSTLVPPGSNQPANIHLRWPPGQDPSIHPEITSLIHPFWIDTARLENALQTPNP